MPGKQFHKEHAGQLCIRAARLRHVHLVFAVRCVNRSFGVEQHSDRPNVTARHGNMQSSILEDIKLYVV